MCSPPPTQIHAMKPNPHVLVLGAAAFGRGLGLAEVMGGGGSCWDSGLCKKGQTRPCPCPCPVRTLSSPSTRQETGHLAFDPGLLASRTERELHSHSLLFLPSERSLLLSGGLWESRRAFPTVPRTTATVACPWPTASVSLWPREGPCMLISADPAPAASSHCSFTQCLPSKPQAPGA